MSHSRVITSCLKAGDDVARATEDERSRPRSPRARRSPDGAVRGAEGARSSTKDSNRRLPFSSAVLLLRSAGGIYIFNRF